MECYCGLDHHDHFKVIRENHTQHGFTYSLGRNDDIKKFQPEKKCGGGLYFCTGIEVIEYLMYGTKLAFVRVPEGAQVCHDNMKSKASSLVVDKIIPLEDFERWSDEKWCLQAVRRCIRPFQYVKVLTPEMMILAYRACYLRGLNLKFIREQTSDLCLIAVQNDGLALRHVRNQSPEICLEAVKQNGLALRYVNEPNHDICLKAVQQNGNAIEYVDTQTEELCLEAVRQTGVALRSIKKQTPEICLTAVHQSGLALCCVRKQTLDICIEAVNQTKLALQFVRNEEIYQICRDLCTRWWPN